MNLALSALLILLLLLPAFSFRIGIAIPLRPPRKSLANATDATGLQQQLTGRNVAKALSKLNFTETIFLFSIVPVVLHLLSLLLLSAASRTVKFDLLLNIFAGKPNVLTAEANGAFQKDLVSFLWYSLVQATAGLLLGFATGQSFLGRGWTLRLVMGNNVWYKVFSGSELPPEKQKKIGYILVEVLALTKETTVIYSGSLKNYEVVQNTDDLAYLTLGDAKRRDLRAGQTSVQRKENAVTETVSSSQNLYGPLVEVPGHNLTVVGKEILNVNVTYFEVVIDKATGQQTLVFLA